MDSKDVDLRSKALMKATAEKQPSSTITKLLDELRKGVQATEELLRATRVGVTVNKLRQHPDPAVAKLATELVSKWRTDVRKTTGSSTPKSANGTASPAPGQTPGATPKPKPKHNVAGDKRNTATDRVDWQVTDNKTRNNCVKLMYDGLAFMTDELPDDVLKVARLVELAAYNAYQPETSDAYKSKIRSLYQNLKNKGNPQLRIDVLSGAIPPKRFVVMSHDELKSKERREEDARLEKENMRVAMTAKEEKSISTTLQCGKCRAKKVSYSQAQTRSADEPMTTFCECLNCGNRWKFS